MDTIFPKVHFNVNTWRSQLWYLQILDHRKFISYAWISVNDPDVQYYDTDSTAKMFISRYIKITWWDAYSVVNLRPSSLYIACAIHHWFDIRLSWWENFRLLVFIFWLPQIQLSDPEFSIFETSRKDFSSSYSVLIYTRAQIIWSTELANNWGFCIWTVATIVPFNFIGDIAYTFISLLNIGIYSQPYNPKLQIQIFLFTCLRIKSSIFI